MARCGITDLPGNISTTTVTKQNVGQSLLWYRQLWSLKLLSARGPLRQKILSVLHKFLRPCTALEYLRTQTSDEFIFLLKFSFSYRGGKLASCSIPQKHHQLGCTSCPSKKPSAFQVRVQNTLYRSRDTIFVLVNVSSGGRERQWANSLNVLDVHTSMQETQEIN